MEDEDITYEPKYFSKQINEENGEEYKYVEDYWGDREIGDWTHMADIFGILNGRPVIMPKELKSESRGDQFE